MGTTRKNRDETVLTRTRKEMLAADEQKRTKMQKEIRELMELKGWTQADLAVEFGVSESTAWRWYEGKAVPIPAFQNIVRRLLLEARSEMAIAQKQPA